MAKKNLHNLMSGIIGTDNKDNNSTPQANTSVESPATVKVGPGRPKKSGINDDTRSTFIVSSELLRKVKYISLMDDRLQKDIINDALSLYVSKWEEDNGKITMQKK